MNLVERLVQADVDKAYELKRDVYKSKRLQELLGTEEPVEVVVKELPQRTIKAHMAMQYSSSGKHQMDRIFDTELMNLVEGVVEPSLKDKDLRDHYRVQTPKELAEVLFGREVSSISDKIMELSGYADDIEEDVKN